MSNLSLNKVIGGFNRREARAIVWIYDAYYPAVFNLVLKLVGDHCPDIEDLVADIFLKLLKSSSRFENLAKIRSFLFSTTKNLCIDYLKNRKIIQNKWGDRDFLERAQPEYAEEPDYHELMMSQVYMAIKKLPGKQRQLFRMTYIKGWSNEQVARILQLSPKTIANAKIIAMNKLKAILEKGGFLIIINIFS